MSSKHCKITVTQNKYSITDLDSSNGTFINGNKIKHSVLRNNNILQLGTQKFRVELPEDEISEPVAQKEDTVIKSAQETAQSTKIQEEHKEQSRIKEIATNITSSEVLEQQHTITDSTKKETCETKNPQLDKIPPRIQNKIKPKIEASEVRKVKKIKSTRTKSNQSTVLWTVIFCIGFGVGIVLIIFSLVLKNAVDAEIYQLKNEIKTLKDDNTKLNNSVRISNMKLNEFTKVFGEFKEKVSFATENIDDIQRKISSSSMQNKMISDEVVNAINNFEAKLQEIETKIEKLNE